MIRLYHCVAARSLRVLWALEELGISYDLEVLRYPPKESHELISVNSLGTVPFLIDGETALDESTAIVQYLATRDGPTELALTPDDDEYGQWLRWITFSEASVTYPLAITIHYSRWYADTFPGTVEHPDVVEYYKNSYLGALNVLQAWLAGRAYLVGGRFTVADICIGYNFRLMELQKRGGEISPALTKYWNLLSERPAYRRALEIEAAASAALHG